MLYKKIKIDKKRRIAKTKFFGIKAFLESFLIANIFLPKKNRLALIHQLGNIKAPVFRKVTRNICFESGKQKSMVSWFRVNRHVFKKNVSKKAYPGIRKASW